MALVWENLSYDTQGTLIEKLQQSCCFAKTNRRLLTNLNGSFAFGELAALMGPSGAGKSTLLKCLTQGKNYYGVNGRIAVESKSKMRTVLITQNDKDHLLDNLTLIESLYYASRIKNPYATTRQQHTEIVEELLNELDLQQSKNTFIEECSGGQKKRIAVGLELTAKIKPNFLFLDEPTSGLDSHAGLSVVFCLRNLAINRKIAIVTVIHQPSHETFSQFHNVYILSKVGHCVFRGSPIYLRRILKFYKYLNSEVGNANPADIIISIASSISTNDDKEEYPMNIDVEAGNVVVPAATIKNSKEMKDDCEKMTKNFLEIWPSCSYARTGHEIQEDGLYSFSATFRLYTLWVLLRRTCISSLWRQKQLIFIRLTLHAVVAIILALLYHRNLGTESGCYAIGFDFKNCSCVESEDKMRHETIPAQNVKFQFFSLLFLMFAALMPTVLTFSSEIKLFINEYRNGWYGTTTYFVSKTLVETPCQFVLPFLYVYFLYWYSQQIGMDDWYGGFFGYMSWRYGYFLAVTIVSCFIAQGIGFLIGIMCVNSFSMSIILSSTMLLFLFLFSGFFVKIIDMNIYTEWITYLSFIRFSFESLLIILYGNNRCEFLPGTNIPGKSSILFTFNLFDEDLNRNLYWLIGHLICTRILALGLLKYYVDPKFIQTSIRHPLCLDRILSLLKSILKCAGKSICYVIKICAIIFIIQIVIGIIVLIVQKNMNR